MYKDDDNDELMIVINYMIMMKLIIDFFIYVKSWREKKNKRMFILECKSLLF